MKRFLLAALLAALLPITAAAQPGPEAPAEAGNDAEQLLAQAEKYYEALEYEAALKTLIAVHQAAGVTAMQKARAFLYMGVCFTALGNAENAVASFMELLKLKPTFRLPPGISPSIQAMFKEALKRMKLPETPPPEGQPPAPPGGEGEDGEGAEGVKVEARAPAQAPAGQAVDVKIQVEDPQGVVEDLVLHWRLVGGPDFSVVRLGYKRGQKQVVGRIPAPALQGTTTGRLQYVVEAMGRGGLSLAHAGTHSAPLEVELQAARKPSRRWRWYVLGVGGGLAIAGGIVAAVLLTRGNGDPPVPTTANVSVTIR